MSIKWRGKVFKIINSLVISTAIIGISTANAADTSKEYTYATSCDNGQSYTCRKSFVKKTTSSELKLNKYWCADDNANCNKRAILTANMRGCEKDDLIVGNSTRLTSRTLKNAGCTFSKAPKCIGGPKNFCKTYNLDGKNVCESHSYKDDITTAQCKWTGYRSCTTNGKVVCRGKV